MKPMTFFRSIRSYRLATMVGCGYIVLLGTICCLCSGTPQLFYHRFMWEAQGIEDYEVLFSYTDPGSYPATILRVCNGEIEEISCVPDLSHEECFLDDDNPWNDRIAPIPVEKLTVNAIFENAISNVWLPTCWAEFDSELHYPSNVGCFFIEGWWIELSEFKKIDCDEYEN